MTCPACTKARASRYSGEYRAGCPGCQARAFARSQMAHDAVKSRSTVELRAALAVAMKDTPIEDALISVWDWWRSDHAEATA